jgi:hypothetical protein
MISALTEDSKNDAKGSAGDKHETALSMMHIEQEKLNSKLSECLSHKNIMDKIDPSVVAGTISLGSLVTANNKKLYLSCALPKINVNGIPVIALSPQSPLGNMLLGKSVGYSFILNGTPYLIEEVQ